MTTTYRLNNKESNLRGEKQIYLRFRGKNKKGNIEDKTIGTGIYVSEKHFTNGTISPHCPNYIVLNANLTKIYGDIEIVKKMLEDDGVFVSPNSVKHKYLGYIDNVKYNKISIVSFWDAYEEYVNMRKHTTQGYLKTLKTLKNRLEEFERWNNNKITFEYITQQTSTFQFNLQDYLWTHRMLSNNYVNKLLANLSNFLYHCHSQRYISIKPKFKYNNTIDRDEKIYLYKDEVMKLFKSDQFDYKAGTVFDNNHIYFIKDVLEGANATKYGDIRYYTNWELVKDTFLFLCSIGCRYSDIPSFKVLHFNFDTENSAFSWIMQKTNKRVQVPRNDISEHIFRKYSRGKSMKQNLFPTLSIQKFNKSLKLVMKELNLNRLVSYPKLIGSSVVDKDEKFLWELISSHSGRRTFIKNMIDMGTMDYHTIMKMSGHRTISQFQKYISVSPHDISKGKNLFKISNPNSTNIEQELVTGFRQLSESNQQTIINLISNLQDD